MTIQSDGVRRILQKIKNILNKKDEKLICAN